MSIRSCLIAIAVLSVLVAGKLQLVAGQDNSVIVEGRAVRGSPTVTIVAVDGHRLRAAQQEVTIGPGRHRIVVRITDLRQAPFELPFEDILEANYRYIIKATLRGHWLKTHVDKMPK